MSDVTEQLDIQGSKIKTLEDVLFTHEHKGFDFTPSLTNFKHYINLRVLGKSTNNSVSTTIGGDFEVPAGFRIKEIGAYVDTAGTTGTQTIDVNVNGTSILSTKITIDSGEKTSRSAATPPVLSTSALQVGDLITIDCDAIQTTPAKGLTVRLTII